MTKLQLSYDLSFEDLYTHEGLRKIDSFFIEKLLKDDLKLCNKMLDARSHHKSLYKLDESELILQLAPHLESFLTSLFKIQNDVEKYKDSHRQLDIIHRCNKTFVQKHVLNLERKNISDINISKVSTMLMMYGIKIPTRKSEVVEAEIDMAHSFLSIYELSKSDDGEWSDYHKQLLQNVEDYCLWAVHTKDDKNFHRYGALFRVPEKLDYNNLIPHLQLRKINRKTPPSDNIVKWIMDFSYHFSLIKALDHSVEYLLSNKSIDSSAFNRCFSVLSPRYYFTDEILLNDNTAYSFLAMSRDRTRDRAEFALNDTPLTAAQISHEANYCLYCHNRAKDSCSKGMNTPEGYKKNPLGVELKGCPLEQKISEMHLLKAQHNVIGALATIVIDNPMVAATGNRICNDCMKACIFQKQQPVDTPSVESSILMDVLHMPFGFEIYSLLTRWNPLNFASPLPKNTNHYKVLVAGMGPAGFTLAHYLLNAGVNVVGIDGLKIEPLQQYLSGINDNGSRCEFKPIRDIKHIFSKLDKRQPKGFGGVMEYGITVRWDKNMLDVIRLLLLRRNHFKLYDGIRFGSNITTELCESIGFDHIALSVGAGKPNMPKVQNILSKGVRMSSDFLMSLHGSGAYRNDVFLPFQIRMPIVVIGSGLTAIDTATEAAQYYIVQIKKFCSQYRQLGDKFISNLPEKDRKTAIEFIAHAKQLLRQSPKKLLEKLGGVTILYRKKLQDSPAYRINHEELSKAFEEGIKFVENAVPIRVNQDEFGYCESITCKIDGVKTVIEAKSIIVATGTNPNTIAADLEHSNKISYFGDADPNYSGSVVKAMASAKHGYKKILDLIHKEIPTRADSLESLDEMLVSRVEKVIRLTPNVVEVIVRSPAAAANFKPGQFFKLQKYEGDSKSKFTMEPLALTGAEVSGDLISLIVLEMGVSSRMCASLKQGEKVVLMGPTGTPTEIPHDETVLLIGGGLGNAVLTSIGKQMREQGCNVLYFAGYKQKTDRFKPEAIEAAADEVVWCCDEGLLDVNRESDKSFHGNIIKAMEQHEGKINLSDIHRVIVIGSDRLMSAVASWRKTSNLIPRRAICIASINSPMSCMMKEVCAQCIQKHKFGSKELYIYSCKNQDQPLDTADFAFLSDRLEQNSLLEKSSDAIFRASKKSKK